jgi:hypothetical protein
MALTTVIGRKKIDFSERHKFITIVGSTKPTEAEKKAAFNWARDSVLAGHIVVSGLATGIDTEAHRGALSVVGDFIKTVAVLATSPNEGIYPRENYQLAQLIKLDGAIVCPYKSKAEWTNSRFGQPQKRLVERDVLQAYLASVIYAASDDEVITGGTRWALNYGKYLKKPMYKLRSDGSCISPFDYRVEPDLIRWKMELDWNAAGEELIQGSYDFWQVN